MSPVSPAAVITTWEPPVVASAQLTVCPRDSPRSPVNRNTSQMPAALLR